VPSKSSTWQANTQLSMIPVIVVSGRDHPGNKQRALGLGQGVLAETLE
jgi:hypothetical protein